MRWRAPFLPIRKLNPVLHSYLILVTDSGTGEPLFLARVADPTAR